ncbi:hypothetical protein BH11PAT4_BH11PAT4_4500 [soil metagenome]
MLTTQQLADRLTELFNAGKALEAEQELYAESIVSHEQDGTTVSGLEGVMEKTKQAHGHIAEFRKGEITKVLVNQDTFIAVFDVDFTLGNGHIVSGIEYGFYKVAEGKVVEEYFYM